MRRNPMTIAVLAVATLTVAGCAGTSSAPAKAVGDATPAAGAPAKTAAVAPGWDPASKTITVSALFPTSGAFANTIQDVIGMKAYFHRATAPGGDLAGYTVKVQNADTQFQTSVAIPEYQKLKASSSMFGVLAAFVANALPLKADQSLVVPADFDSGILKNPNFLPIYPSFEIFAANAVSYEAEVEGKKDAVYCTMVNTGPIGDQTVAGVKYAASKLGLKFGTAVSSVYPATDVTPQVVKLRAAGCTVVVAGVIIPGMQQLAARAAQLNYAPTWLASGTTYASDIATGTAASYIKKNVKYVFTGADWDDKTVPGQVNLVADVEAVAPGSPPAMVTYETGYITGIAMSAVFKKALANGDMSRAGLVAASNQIGKVDMFGLGGGSYDYGTSPATRKPPRAVTIYTVTSDTKEGVKTLKANYTSSVGDTVPLSSD